MLVQFVTDQAWTVDGFSAKIHRTSINPICKDQLNVAAGFLESPGHPTMDCSWVITASIGSTISIQFQVFFAFIMYLVSFRVHILFRFSLLANIE